ncbi:MAG TPA: NAD(P)/FAD-dependent oxidoreductase [Actinomycetota bacterium]|nr:NAD(P)/FAD-dependent oxidoreductase [Actinomycetota bacterium]
MADTHDVIVVGGGHNGLTCACYLAKAGKRVLVLEARDVVGGGCATKEVAAPGFRHNFHSNFHGIIHMGPVYQDLELERYGATYVWPENQFAHVFPDGKALVCSRDLDQTVANIARFSKRDANTFRDVALQYREVLEQGMIPAMFSAPQAPSKDIAPLEESTEGLGMLRHFFSSPNHVARDLFETPEVQTWIGFWVAQLAGTGDVFGLGANYPVMIAGSMQPYGWAICVGGSNNLAQAMAKFLTDHGGEIRLDAPVRRIEVSGGAATAIELNDGERLAVGEATVVSNLDPRHTFLELVGESELPASFAPAVKRWRYDVMSMFCVYLALDAPVRWKAAEWDPAVERCFAVSLCESLDVLDDNASDCRLGIPPRQPGLFTVHPSLFDSSLAPEGKEACFCEQIAPYDLREGGPEAWEKEKWEYAEVVLDRWRPYLASGLEPEAVVGRYVSSPIDIERIMPSMKHGDWNHGEMSQDQLGIFRPFHEYPPYRTAFENVYMCGASTHPGGSIGGACGYNAANAIAEDRAISKWWKSPWG